MYKRRMLIELRIFEIYKFKEKEKFRNIQLENFNLANCIGVFGTPMCIARVKNSSFVCQMLNKNKNNRCS